VIVLDWADLVERKGPDLPAETAMTIGVFDGVHRGHQGLIGQVINRFPLIPTVLTFRRNPKEVLRKSWEGELLSLNRKLTLFENLGVSVAVLIDFSEGFSKLRGRDFLELLRGPGNMRFLAVGDNFRCGFGLDTGAFELRALNNEMDIPTAVVAPVSKGGLPVSSSRIRKAIQEGDLAGAAALLGRRVEIDVDGLPQTPEQGGIRYDARLRKRVIPPDGVYSAFLYGTDLPHGEEAVVSVEEGEVFVPSQVNPLRIELLTGP
jgi:riboflavin kinase/FMN adenylyltransferase